MLRSTLVAAKKVTLPACAARTVHVPVAKKVKVLPFSPDVVQTLVVCDAKVTGLPDAPPVATRVMGGDPPFTEAGGLKVIVWIVKQLV
jgi:hypothetical protein